MNCGDGRLYNAGANHQIGCEIVHGPANGNEGYEVDDPSARVAQKTCYQPARISLCVGYYAPNLSPKDLMAFVDVLWGHVFAFAASPTRHNFPAVRTAFEPSRPPTLRGSPTNHSCGSRAQCGLCRRTNAVMPSCFQPSC